VEFETPILPLDAATPNRDTEIEVHPTLTFIPEGWQMPKQPRVLSHGGGKDSTVYLGLCMESGNLPDLVMGADTWHEEPTTYEMWSAVRQVCMNLNIPFVVVRRPYGILQRWHRQRRLFLPHRRVKSCSTWSKIGAIRTWLKENGISNKKPGQATMLICYNADEETRVANSRHKSPKWIPSEYPLFDMGIHRADFPAVLERVWKGPEPKKSGCVFCPNGGPLKAARCAKEYPEIFAQWQAVEENVKPGSGYFFQGFPLRVVKERVEQGRDPPKEKGRPWPSEEQQSLMFCDDGGGCFT